MKFAWQMLVRAGLILLCCFISWRSIRLAAADSISAPGTAVSLARAVAIEPNNADLVARAALVRNDSGDQSPEVDRDLERALQLNPLNAELLIALGQRREFAGDIEGAARYLGRAADVDHAFRTSWAWADFCYRNNRPDEVWRMARRCLALEPLAWDPTPIFDLAWRMEEQADGADSKKILSLMPHTGARPIQYLRYLIGTNRVDAAIEEWPLVLNALDPSSPVDVGALTDFPNILVKNDRIQAAVRAWNQLVDLRLIQSGHLDPDRGLSVADATFAYPPVKNSTFGWATTGEAGAFASVIPSMLRFEFDGNEPESLPLLAVTAPVVAGKPYRLAWKYDSSRLVSPKDAGFAFVVARESGETLTQCPPALAQPDTGSCTFTAPPVAAGKPDYEAIRIELRYGRALGTVRIKGELRLTDIHLEFGR